MMVKKEVTCFEKNLKVIMVSNSSNLIVDYHGLEKNRGKRRNMCK